MVFQSDNCLFTKCPLWADINYGTIQTLLLFVNTNVLDKWYEAVNFTDVNIIAWIVQILSLYTWLKAFALKRTWNWCRHSPSLFLNMNCLGLSGREVPRDAKALQITIARLKMNSTRETNSIETAARATGNEQLLQKLETCLQGIGNLSLQHLRDIDINSLR